MTQDTHEWTASAVARMMYPPVEPVAEQATARQALVTLLESYSHERRCTQVIREMLGNPPRFGFDNISRAVGSKQPNYATWVPIEVPLLGYRSDGSVWWAEDVVNFRDTGHSYFRCVFEAGFAHDPGMVTRKNKAAIERQVRRGMGDTANMPSNNYPVNALNVLCAHATGKHEHYPCWFGTDFQKRLDAWYAAQSGIGPRAPFVFPPPANPPPNPPPPPPLPPEEPTGADQPIAPPPDAPEYNADEAEQLELDPGTYGMFEDDVEINEADLQSEGEVDDEDGEGGGGTLVPAIPSKTQRRRPSRSSAICKKRREKNLPEAERKATGEHWYLYALIKDCDEQEPYHAQLLELRNTHGIVITLKREAKGGQSGRENGPGLRAKEVSHAGDNYRVVASLKGPVLHGTVKERLAVRLTVEHAYLNDPAMLKFRLPYLRGDEYYQTPDEATWTHVAKGAMQRAMDSFVAQRLQEAEA